MIPLNLFSREARYEMNETAKTQKNVIRENLEQEVIKST